MDVLEINDLSFSYNKQDLVIENVNLKMKEGEFVAIIGDNGTGKTTLFNLIVHFLKPKTGIVKLYGETKLTKKAISKISYVPQLGTELFSSFSSSVYEFIASNLYKENGPFKKKTKEQKQRIDELLEKLQINDLKYRSLDELSGGQKQRVLIARALVSKPQLILLDEPTTGVDERTIDNLYKLLFHLNKEEKISILMITHSVKDIINYVDSVYCLHHRHLDMVGINELKEEITHRHKHIHKDGICND